MSKPLFVRLVPQIEKAAPKAQVKPSALAVVGVITLGLVGAAIALYSMQQSDAGRLVIDLAVAFLSWSTGQAVGEKAGFQAR